MSECFKLPIALHMLKTEARGQTDLVEVYILTLIWSDDHRANILDLDAKRSFQNLQIA